MKLSRRSFFGILPGAVVGGKAAIKAAAAEAAEKLALAMPEPGAMGFSGSGPPSAGHTDWAVTALRRLADETFLSERRREMRPVRLDPDIAANRSMSLSVKMLHQRDRDFERSIANEKTYLQRTIEGFWS